MSGPLGSGGASMKSVLWVARSFFALLVFSVLFVAWAITQETKVTASDDYWDKAQIVRMCWNTPIYRLPDGRLGIWRGVQRQVFAADVNADQACGVGR